jgi:glutamate/tyrosine decarboxylase-like PLP-dependent enzyme
MPDIELAEVLRRLRHVATAVNERVADGPVAEAQTLAEVRARIENLFDLDKPTSPEKLVEQVVARLAADNVQVTHPRYFGLFNPAVPPITVVAEAVDEEFCMDVAALRDQLRRDRGRGEQPFLVVATAGTTATGVIDPLESIAEVAREAGIWMHADAAWGGGALLSERLRPALAGIEAADSMTWDAHKWLSVPMAAGMIFSRRPDPVRAAFDVHTTYVPPGPAGTDDPYTVSWQWSRRFIGLKVFMALAEVGMQGYAERVEHQAEMGDRLRRRLQESGWSLRNRTPLPLVCFSHSQIESGRTTAAEVVGRVITSGQAWASTIRLPAGEEVVRACVCNYRTSPADIDATVRAFDRALSAC